MPEFATSKAQTQQPAAPPGESVAFKEMYVTDPARSEFHAEQRATSGIHGAIALERLQNLGEQLKTALDGQPITRQNVLQNSEARRIQLEMLELYPAIANMPMGPGVAPTSEQNIAIATAPTHSQPAGMNSGFAVRMAIYEFKIELLNIGLREALDSAEPTWENIMANPVARRHQLLILNTMDQFPMQARMAWDQQPTVLGSFIGIERSKQRLEIYRADLNDALGGLPVTPENLLANNEALKIHMKMLEESAKYPHVITGITLGESSPPGAPTGRLQTNPSLFSLGVESQLMNAVVGIYQNDLDRALNGAEATAENIFSSPEARAAKLQILALQYRIADVSKIMAGLRMSEQVSLSHIRSQMIAITQADLTDALGGKEVTPENIASNARAYAAYQRIQNLMNSNVTLNELPPLE